jgi:hypothetical protein
MYTRSKRTILINIGEIAIAITKPHTVILQGRIPKVTESNAAIENTIVPMMDDAKQHHGPSLLGFFLINEIAF